MERHASGERLGGLAEKVGGTRFPERGIEPASVAGPREPAGAGTRPGAGGSRRGRRALAEDATPDRGPPGGRGRPGSPDRTMLSGRGATPRVVGRGWTSPPAAPPGSPPPEIPAAAGSRGAGGVSEGSAWTLKHERWPFMFQGDHRGSDLGLALKQGRPVLDGASISEPRSCTLRNGSNQGCGRSPCPLPACGRR